MGFSPEDRLLIQCSRAQMEAEAIATASDLLKQDLDWGYVLETSIRHGVSPLFYHGLTQVVQVTSVHQLVPAQIVHKLQELYRNSRSRNRRLGRVIGEIFGAFERAGVQAMGLKDIQLAREVYPDVGLRPMGDVDILIHREDYDQVAACMADLGFVPLPSDDIPFTLRYAWAHHFHRPADDVWVDVQWNILQIEWDAYQEGNFDFEIERVWRGASSMTLGDHRILVPNPEDMLFHLCLHLEGHGYAELILFCDIAELLKRHDHQLDWRYVIDISTRYQVESSVYYVLSLVQRLFQSSLPPLLLQELEPTYFKASVLKPLFGNLTRLHLLLDEIRLAVSPPAQVIEGFEAIARQQATSAMQLFREIDEIAVAFREAGGELIILDGAPSERIFPDPSLEPFGEIHLLILERNLPRMHQTLIDRGFILEDANHARVFAKEWQVTSADPALAGQPVSIVLQGRIEKGLDLLLRPQASPSTSKKRIALRSIGHKLGAPEGGRVNIPVRIKITALSPEGMLVYASARLSQQTQSRLFGFCGLLEVLRRCSDSTDWSQVKHRALQYGMQQQVGEGMLLVSELMDDDRVLQVASALLGETDSQPRVLEWARYGPDEFDLHTGFKRAFFYLFCFLSIGGAKARLTYLLGSLLGRWGSKPVLPGLALEVATGLVSSFRRKRHTAADFAYWAEPEMMPETESGNT